MPKKAAEGKPLLGNKTEPRRGWGRPWAVVTVSLGGALGCARLMRDAVPEPPSRGAGVLGRRQFINLGGKQ